MKRRTGSHVCMLVRRQLLFRSFPMASLTDRDAEQDVASVELWKWCLLLFAGSYAEAFETRRSFARTLRTSGKLDLEAAAPAVAWLVRCGYARTRIGSAEARSHGDAGVSDAARGRDRARGCRAAQGRQAHCPPGSGAGADLIAVARQRAQFPETFGLSDLHRFHRCVVDCFRNSDCGLRDLGELGIGRFRPK
jgi:hypothetical protein